MTATSRDGGPAVDAAPSATRERAGRRRWRPPDASHGARTVRAVSGQRPWILVPARTSLGTAPHDRVPPGPPQPHAARRPYLGEVVKRLVSTLAVALTAGLISQSAPV